MRTGVDPVKRLVGQSLAAGAFPIAWQENRQGRGWLHELRVIMAFSPQVGGIVAFMYRFLNLG